MMAISDWWKNKDTPKHEDWAEALKRYEAIQAEYKAEQAAHRAKARATWEDLTMHPPVYIPTHFTAGGRPAKVLGVELSTIAHMKLFFEEIGCPLTDEAIDALRKELKNE